MNAANTAKPASSWMPLATPWSMSLPAELTELCASLAALFAVLSLMPRFLRSFASLFVACDRWSRMLPAWSVTPPITSTKISTPSRMMSRRISAVPPARGTPWLCIQPTPGPATDAISSATITGMTIVLVSASSQIIPTSTSARPTSSQETSPASRSHGGATKIRVSSPGSISRTRSSPGTAWPASPA